HTGLAPVRPSESRSAESSVVRVSTSSARSTPFTLNLILTLPGPRRGTLGGAANVLNKELAGTKPPTSATLWKHSRRLIAMRRENNSVQGGIEQEEAHNSVVGAGRRSSMPFSWHRIRIESRNLGGTSLKARRTPARLPNLHAEAPMMRAATG